MEWEKIFLLNNPSLGGIKLENFHIQILGRPWFIGLYFMRYLYINISSHCRNSDEYCTLWLEIYLR